MSVLLAVAVDEGATTFRFAYTDDELADIQADIDAAQRALDYALANYQGPKIDTRREALAAAEAALDAATPYLNQVADFRVDEILRLDDSLVRVLLVTQTTIGVDRGLDGTIPTAHDAGTPIIPVPAIGTATLEVLIDGSGAAIETGEKGQVIMPFPGRLTRVRLLADQTGTAVVDIVRSAFVDAPGSGISITGATKPELDAEASYEDAVLVDWTRDLAADDVLGVIVEEATGIERLTLVLTVAL
jgi:hypothetical protein